MSGNDDEDIGEEHEEGTATKRSKKSSKKKKKKEKSKKELKANEGEDDDCSDAGIEKPLSAKKTKKKKHHKKKDGGGDDEEQEIEASSEGKTKKKKKKDTSISDGLDEEMADVSLVSSAPTASPSDFDKYSVEYFEAILEEIRAKCERKLKLKAKDKEAFAMTCQNYYDTWTAKQENDRLLTELLDDNNPDESSQTEQLVEERTRYGKELDETILKRKKWCIKSAFKVFMGLKEDSLMGLEEKLVTGAIIAQATPAKLAEFASKSKTNEKLLKKLFGNAELMKEMLLHGGAVKYEYGEAIRIFADCMAVDDGSSKKMKNTDQDEDTNVDKWMIVNRKIALACALELASPVYEFDSMTQMDPVARYQHFVEAHRSGELDPAFPFFSVWEMRQIVNCDAPNDQMSWCRKMVMNYAPHLTCLTDLTLRYVYMLQSDVRIRKPEWTGSPRTYPMVLSGGGNESVNSWFGRFILKSFGLPSWGTKFRRKEGYTRWTPEGWVALNGADWNTCSWRGKTGKDFQTELEARNKAPHEEYFKRLVTLQCLADIVDGDPSSILEEEKDVFHADRMWRSMSIVSMELLFQTEPEVERTFERKGKGIVVTNCEKYLEKFQSDALEADISYDEGNGVLIIPVSKHGFSDGNIIVIESFTGGKQLNFVANGTVEYELPENVPNRTFTLTCEACTVSSKQVPLKIKVGDEDDFETELEIPYTKGEWQSTDGVDVEISGGTIIRFSRPNGSLGLSIKKFILS